ASAGAQVARIAAVRGVSPDQVRRLVAANTEDRQLGILGEPRVNVLTLNLALDRLAPRMADRRAARPLHSQPGMWMPPRDMPKKRGAIGGAGVQVCGSVRDFPSLVRLRAIFFAAILVTALPILPRATAQETPPAPAQPAPSNTLWHYGGFIDVGYLYDF